MLRYFDFSASWFSLFLFGAGCTTWQPAAGAGPCGTGCKAEIVNIYPHDTNAFTEGLLFDDGRLYESVGLAGQSALRRTQLESGAIEISHALSASEFAEGIAVAGERIVQLTWKNGTAYVLNKSTLAVIDTWNYSSEGWGLTFDGARFIMSDGSATLFLRSAQNFAELGRIDVHDVNGPVANLNELEFIDGLILANVWLTDTIVLIDPSSGEVRGHIALNDLWPAANRTSKDDVPNGIAYDSATGRIFVTGKRWPNVFEIRYTF